MESSTIPHQRSAPRSGSLGDRSLPYSGLCSDDVKINREKYGINVISPPERQPWYSLYLEKFADPVIRILVIAAGIALGVGIFEGGYAEALGIVIAIFLATTLAFLNEYKANQEFQLLNQVYDQIKVKVIRDGQYCTIPRQDLVVEDIVYVERGEEIPADGIVLESASLFMDQSKITGESEAVLKLAPSDPEIANLPEQTYPPTHLYRSTIVDRGHGLFKVTAVGDRTEIGQVATAVATVESGEMTPLNIQLEKLSQLIGVVGLSFSGLIFLALLIRGFLAGELSLTFFQRYFVSFIIASVLVALIPVWLPIVYDGLELLKSEVKRPDWLEDNGVKSWLGSFVGGLLLLLLGMGLAYAWELIPATGSWLPVEVGRALLNYFMVAVTIIVVAVPEGLAMSVTLSLAYSMRKMAASNNLVRQMHACETVGAATVICSDKTGTLTCNQMQVKEVAFPSLSQNTNLIAECIAANSTADLEKKSQQAPSVIGNATEGALLLWLDGQNLDYIHLRDRFAIKSQMAFSTEKKYMATLGTSSVTESLMLYVKGAPEVVLNYCSHQLGEKGKEPLSNKSEILRQMGEYQGRGMRVLGFAFEPSPVGRENLEAMEPGLIWLGFTAIADPLRSEVPEAIQACLHAGIGVKIVTGDSPEIAREIARGIGLWQEEDEGKPYVHLTANKFNQLSDSEAAEAVKSLKIMSRACPLDKLRLVKLLQSNGEVVGVTGDGTNDAAALKQAQVGLSMGSGTAIAKEASDIILLDDSFASIVQAVVWGRSLYQNIQRFLLFQLTINVVALGIALLGPFIGVSLPLTVTQMLWVNLIMDTFAALALATEPPNLRVMEQQPRDPEAFIITPEMGKNLLVTGLTFLVFLVGFLLYLPRLQSPVMNLDDYELSIFFAVFVLLQFWNLFNVRSWGMKQSAFVGLNKNKGFIAIALSIFLGQILIIQFGGSVFRTVPLSLQDWLMIIAGTSIVLWVGELWRLLSRKTMASS